MHLLIVEDERTLCDTVARSLRRSAYSVDCCYDGEKALELLETERYDLVLLDLNLPGAGVEGQRAAVEHHIVLGKLPEGQAADAGLQLL